MVSYQLVLPIPTSQVNEIPGINRERVPSSFPQKVKTFPPSSCSRLKNLPHDEPDRSLDLSQFERRSEFRSESFPVLWGNAYGKANLANLGESGLAYFDVKFEYLGT